MKAYLSAALFAATAILTTPQVLAHDKDHHDKGRHSYDRYDDRYDNGYQVHDSYYRYSAQPRYVQARVVRVDRIGGYSGDYSRYCGTYDNHNSRSGINEGAVVGAVIGGLVGNQASSGQTRVAATVAGAAIGGLIGQSVDRNNGGSYDRQYVQCRSDWSENRRRDVDYRVTYRYQNRYFTTVMPYYPGPYVQVRVARDYPGKQNIVYRY